MNDNAIVKLPYICRYSGTIIVYLCLKSTLSVSPDIVKFYRVRFVHAPFNPGVILLVFCVYLCTFDIFSAIKITVHASYSSQSS